MSVSRVDVNVLCDEHNFIGEPSLELALIGHPSFKNLFEIQVCEPMLLMFYKGSKDSIIGSFEQNWNSFRGVFGALISKAKAFLGVAKVL